MKTLLIWLAILLHSLPAYAGGVLMMNGGVAAVAASNGEVGNKSGANDDTTTPNTYPGNDQALIGCFAAGTSGTISYIHARMNTSSGTTGQQYNAGIYSAAGSLIADATMISEPGTIPGTISFQLDSTTTVTETTTYCLSIAANNSPDGWTISSTIDLATDIRIDTDYPVGDSLPASMDVATLKVDNYSMRIWATNTADGT